MWHHCQKSKYSTQLWFSSLSFQASRDGWTVGCSCPCGCFCNNLLDPWDCQVPGWMKELAWTWRSNYLTFVVVCETIQRYTIQRRLSVQQSTGFFLKLIVPRGEPKAPLAHFLNRSTMSAMLNADMYIDSIKHTFFFFRFWDFFPVTKITQDHLHL